MALAAKVKHGDHLRLASWRAVLCAVLASKALGGFLLIWLLLVGAHAQPGTFGNEIQHPSHGLQGPP